MIAYIICGVAVLVFLLLLEIQKEGYYEVSLIDIFIMWSIITLWPIALLIYTFRNKIKITDRLFDIGKK